MNKYRTRQTEVEAHQLTDGDNSEALKWCGGVPTESVIEGKLFHVPRLDERHSRTSTVARVGDWIVRTVNGFAVLTNEEFQARYEEIKTGKAEVKA